MNPYLNILGASAAFISVSLGVGAASRWLVDSLMENRRSRILGFALLWLMGLFGVTWLIVQQGIQNHAVVMLLVLLLLVVAGATSQYLKAKSKGRHTPERETA